MSVDTNILYPMFAHVLFYCSTKPFFNSSQLIIQIHMIIQESIPDVKKMLGQNYQLSGSPRWMLGGVTTDQCSKTIKERRHIST